MAQERCDPLRAILGREPRTLHTFVEEMITGSRGDRRRVDGTYVLPDNAQIAVAPRTSTDVRGRIAGPAEDIRAFPLADSHTVDTNTPGGQVRFSTPLLQPPLRESSGSTKFASTRTVSSV